MHTRSDKPIVTMPAHRSTLKPAAAEAVPPPSINADATSSLAAASLPDAKAGAKLLLVEFRSGEAVVLHPEVMPLLRQGWRVRSAVPRIVEGEGLKLLVTLTQPSKVPSKKRRTRRAPSFTEKKLS